MLGRIRLLLILPLILFAVFCGLLAQRIMREDQGGLASVLIGRPAPPLEPAMLGLMPPPGDGDIAKAELKLVNFWASWCAPCRVEHPNLAALANAGIPIYGINYKDNAGNALRFLEELGNPFHRVGADLNGSIAIDWGVYGVPETFIVDRDGNVRHRYAGPITARVLNGTILPEINRLNDGQSNRESTDGTQ